jgi:hypothetical protein
MTVSAAARKTVEAIVEEKAVGILEKSESGSKRLLGPTLSLPCDRA